MKNKPNIIHKFTILSVLFHRNFKIGQIYIHRDYVHSSEPSKFTVEIIKVLKHKINFKHLSNTIYTNEYMSKGAFNFTFQLWKDIK
jgi:hypothetical protein